MAPHFPWNSVVEELFLNSISEALETPENYSDSKKNIKSCGWNEICKVCGPF